VGTGHIVWYKSWFFFFFLITRNNRLYPYFGVVVGLTWSNDPESDGSGFSAGQVKGDDPDKKV
jgi:hypothetical protein